MHCCVFLSDESKLRNVIFLDAHINVKPHPTQYGDGWGITKGFDSKFCPEGGAFDLN